MAEFLIKNFIGGDESPGDIVEVRPDGSTYGRKELLPEKFLIIKVPGLDHAAALHLMDALYDPLYYNPENPGAKNILKRRRYTIADALKFLGPYLVTGNIYEIPFHASWSSILKDKSVA